MAVVPRAAFRTLLADCSRSTFADFVADLWRAKGETVGREGERVVVDDEVLLPVLDPGDEPPDDGRLVVARRTGSDADAVGADSLYEMLLYGVDRERAAAVFEAHFGRPLDDDWSDLVEEHATEQRTPSAGEDTSDRESSEGSKRSTDGSGEAEPETDGTAARVDPPPMVPARVRALVLSLDDAVPRDREAVARMATDRRVLAAALLVVVLSGGVYWGLFVHQPAGETPSDVPFETTDSTYPLDDAYRVVAQFETTVNGETYSTSGTRTHAPGEPSMTLVRWTYGGPDGQTTVVRYERNESFTRQTWTNTAEYRKFRDMHRSDEGFVRAVDATRTLYTTDRDVASGTAVFGNGLPLSMLKQLSYERRGTATHDGREAVRYVPESGWVMRTYGLLDDRQVTWVRTATGEVLVDPDDGDVLRADVEATVVDADTWVDALTGPGTGLAVEYEVQSGVERPAQPPWVDEIESRRAESR